MSASNGSWADDSVAPMIRGLARELTMRLLSRMGDPRGRQRLIIALARGLRESIVAASAPDAADWRSRLTYDLACAIDARASREPLAAVLADLRLFGHLSLRECADIVEGDHEALRSAWRLVRRSLLVAVRRSRS